MMLEDNYHRPQSGRALLLAALALDCILVVSATSAPRCRCGINAILRVSGTPKNFNRSFWTCRNSKQCSFFQWQSETMVRGSGKRLREPAPLHTLPLKRQAIRANPAHRQTQGPLACRSENVLNNWPVYVVAIQLKKPLQGEELRTFRSHVNGKVFHNHEMQRLVATTRVPHKFSTAASEVLFTRKPQSSSLQILTDLLGATTCTASLRGTENISATTDWKTYKSLQTIWLKQQLQGNGTKVKQEPSGDLLIDMEPKVRAKVVQAAFPGLNSTRCRIIRLHKVSLTYTTACDSESQLGYFLLVKFEVVHRFEPQEGISVAQMLEDGTIRDGCPVKSVEVAIRHGVLCPPQENSSISENRSSLSGRSLLSFHWENYPIRRKWLRNADPSTCAVGLRQQDGKVADYPPQLLTPVFGVENLEKPARELTKLKPCQWLQYAEEVRGLVRKAMHSRTPLEAEMWNPEIRQAPTPRLIDGPVAKLVRVLPLFMDSIPTARVGRLLQDLDGHRRKDRRLRNANWTWSEVVTYSANDGSVAAQVEIEMKLQSVLSQDTQTSDTRTIILAAIPAHDTSFRPMLKRLAAINFQAASQCLEKIPDSPWDMREILISMDAKCGGQHRLAPDLAQQGTFFVAFDVARNAGVRGVSVGCGTAVIGAGGRVLQQHQEVEFHRGERLPDELVERQLGLCLQAAKVKSGNPAQRLVVSRDGRFPQSELDACRRTARQYNCSRLDLVEVTKSGPDFFRVLDSSAATQPLSGTYFQLRNSSAVLVTIGADSYLRQIGLVRPLCITLVEGETSIDQVVREQFQLSRLNSYSLRNTRLPNHVHLADRSALDILRGVRYPHTDGIHAA